ncbi:hypothetical protein QVD17_30547 [Tagetes erecta]|uniref:MULE transposase domain-containing protein n=1 Tax=Tagetes erecta TaxID=13708 RepID=A0AAD8K3U5_TARER|nr:hypothetical protein QVD17_30547 [Tagetes erecta]
MIRLCRTLFDTWAGCVWYIMNGLGRLLIDCGVYADHVNVKHMVRKRGNDQILKNHRRGLLTFHSQTVDNCIGTWRWQLLNITRCDHGQLTFQSQLDGMLVDEEDLMIDWQMKKKELTFKSQWLVMKKLEADFYFAKRKGLGYNFMHGMFRVFWAEDGNGLDAGDRDAQMIVDSLEERVMNRQNFSFEFTVVGTELRSLFWVDDVMKCNYEAFGDVLAFDATYGTNMYKMIFVPFTGVDHHKRCVTFAAGLLCDETIESYKWLLSRFLDAHKKQPLLVLTDQDAAMKQVVATVFNESIHQLCMWHIMRKLPVKISVVDGTKTYTVAHIDRHSNIVNEFQVTLELGDNSVSCEKAIENAKKRKGNLRLCGKCKKYVDHDSRNCEKMKRLAAGANGVDHGPSTDGSNSVDPGPSIAGPLAVVPMAVL